MNKGRKVMIAAVILIVLGVGGLFGYGTWQKDEVEETGTGIGENIQDDRYITYNGTKYEYNYNLRNILFIGVDKSEEMKESEAGQGGQSDALILLSMDKEKKATSILEIPRDSMVDVKIYDVNRTYLSTERAQIALQYAYGDGENLSCELTEEAVSELLYGIPISSYIAMGVDGIAEITNLMGGVNLTVL